MLHVNGFVEHFGGHVSATAKGTGSHGEKDAFFVQIPVVIQGPLNVEWHHPKNASWGGRKRSVLSIADSHVLDSNLNASAEAG